MMSVPKELKRKIEEYKEAFLYFLNEGSDSDVDDLRRKEQLLEADLGRAGVKNPKHVLKAARTEVEDKRIAERIEARRQKSEQQLMA